LIYFNLKKSVL